MMIRAAVSEKAFIRRIFEPTSKSKKLLKEMVLKQRPTA